MTIKFNRPSIIGHELTHIQEALNRGQLSGDGYFTEKCSRELEKATSAKKALLTHSCTAALEMAAILCDLGPGDEVVMPSFTFVSTANAVVLRGATPVFVDIDMESLNVRASEFEKNITNKTKAIFVVHYAGMVFDMDNIRALADKRGLILVEDAAQALGSEYKGRLAGSFGDLAAFSFHETKNVISGEGGVLCINNDSMIKRAEIIREKGTNRSQFFRGQVDKYTWVDVGSSYLPGELISAFLYGQLECREEVLAKRLSAFSRYYNAFEKINDSRLVALPCVPPESKGNGHMFYLILDSLETRTEFIEFMKEKGVMTPFHYIPLHSSPAGVKFGKYNSDMYNTNFIADRLVRLPMYFELGRDIEKVIGYAESFFE